MWVQVGSLVRNPSSHVYYYQTYRNRYFKKGEEESSWKPGDGPPASATATEEGTTDKKSSMEDKPPQPSTSATAKGKANLSKVEESQDSSTKEGKDSAATLEEEYESDGGNEENEDKGIRIRSNKELLTCGSPLGTAEEAEAGNEDQEQQQEELERIHSNASSSSGAQLRRSNRRRRTYVKKEDSSDAVHDDHIKQEIAEEDEEILLRSQLQRGRDRPATTPDNHDCNSQESVQSFSHHQQQLLQAAAAAGLPYLHLLPPAMRNDAAARLFFMSPGAAAESMINPSMIPVSNSSSSSASSRSSSGRNNKNERTMAEQQQQQQRSGNAFICEPCNIKFSSANTLEAHQTFYCSFRKDPDKDGVEKIVITPELPEGISTKTERRTPSNSSVASIPNTSNKRSRHHSATMEESYASSDIDPDEHELSIDESANAGQDLEANKALKTGKLYQCIYCSYSADKKVSLNRHMRMHSGGLVSSTNTNSNSNDESGRSCSTPFAKGDTSSAAVTPSSTSAGNSSNANALDRYCSDCDIQFSSIKTYRVHKQYYCSTRHVLKGGPPPGPIGPITIAPPPGTPTSPSAGIPPRPSTKGSVSPASPSTSCSPTPLQSHQSQPFVMLPTSPVIVVPYCYIQGATILPGNVLPNQNALLVLPNGIVQSLPNTLIIPPNSSPPMPIQRSRHHSPASNSGPASPPPQLMFNDPKDMIKRMSGNSSRNSSAEDLQTAFNLNVQMMHLNSKESVSRNSSRGRDAMDLTFRSQQDDEKENSHCRSSVGSNRSSNSGRSSSHHQQGSRNADEQLDLLNHHHDGTILIKRNGSNHSSRPSSASISSNCSASPPAMLPNESTSNGLKMERLSPSSAAFENQQQMLFQQHHRGKSKRQPSSEFEFNNNNRSKFTHPIATQFPGGAILTSATNSSQSLAELLMSNPSDLNEGLLKLNLLNSANSTTAAAAASASMMAAAAASLPPELALRFLSDPTYLNSLQQTFQAQHQQLQQQSKLAASAGATSQASISTKVTPVTASGANSSVPTPSIKRGVSKCVECDIVFYKYENYLVHKEHYCAARATANSSDSTLVNGDVKESRDPSPQVATRQRRTTTNSATSSNNNSSPSLRFSQQRQSTNSPLPTKRKGSPENTNATELTMLNISSEGSGTSALLTIPSKKLLKANEKRLDGNSPPILSSGVTITPSTGRSSTPSIAYSCIQCGVKFSSLDTLKTHQVYYCKGGPGTGVGSELIIEENDVDTKSTNKHGDKQVVLIVDEKSGILKCGNCKLIIPEDQMKVHGSMCQGTNTIHHNTSANTGSSSINNGWKCPCCDTFSPTMSSAQKHLETHSGIRAFKCVLCGYRGNTIRGMRTHIRMHFDKRVSSELHEADYITCVTSKDLEGPSSGHHQQNSHNHNNNSSTIVISPAAASAAVHGALKMSSSSSPVNHYSQSSSPNGSPNSSKSPPVTSATILTTTASKGNNNNNTKDVVLTGGNDGGGGRGHHSTAAQAMLYVT